MNNHNNSQILQKVNPQKQFSHLFFVSPIKLDPEPEFSKLSQLVFADTLNRLFLKKTLNSEIIWGFNAFTPSLENFAKTNDNLFASRHVQDDDSNLLPGNQSATDNRLNFNTLKICLAQEEFWHNTNRLFEGRLDPKKTFNTLERRNIERMWSDLAELWLSNNIVKKHSLSLYNPVTRVSFSPDLDKKNIILDKQRSAAPIVKLKMTEISRRKMVHKILTETEIQIASQEGIKQELATRLLEIREIGGVGRKSRFDPSDSEYREELDSFQKSSFINSKYKSINWDTFNSNDEFEEEVRAIREKLHILEENIITLTKLKETINSKLPINFLTWLTSPFTFLANVAIAVNPEAEYSLYYLENNREFVLVSENRAIPVISLQIDPKTLNAEEMANAVTQGMDGGEYFDRIGEKIFKIASFLGKDLEGVEYDHPIDNSWWNLSWTEKSNCLKVYSHPDVATDKGTGIQTVAPGYNFIDFEIAGQRNLPIITLLDQDGNLVIDGNSKELSGLVGQFYIDASNTVTALLERKKALFAGLVTHLDQPFYLLWQGTDDQGNHQYIKQSLYLQAQKTYALSGEYVKNQLEKTNMESSRISYMLEKDQGSLALTSPNQIWGIPLPIWEDSQSNQIFIKSISQLVIKAINPIYILLNHRDLNPKLYETGQILIYTDKNTKLPLGINAVQYRSNILTDMRREKNMDADNFSNYASRVMEEIQSLFIKYPTIQIILDNDEQIRLSAWLNGTSSERNSHERIFYFYQALQEIQSTDQNLFEQSKEDLILDKFLPKGSIKLLKPQRPNLDEIIIMDELGGLFYRVPEVLNLNVVNALNTRIFSKLNKDIEETYYLWHSQEYYEWWIPSLALGSLNPGARHLILKSDIKAVISEEMLTEFSRESIRQCILEQEFAFVRTGEVNELEFQGKPINGEMSVELNDIDMQIAGSIYLKDTLSALDEQQRRVFTPLLENLTGIATKAHQGQNSKTNRQYYQHSLNVWLKVMTQDYCKQLKNAIDGLKFREAFQIYWSYLHHLYNRYCYYASTLDGYYLSESLSCLQDCLLKFCSIAWTIQPFSCRDICKALSMESSFEALPYMEVSVNQDLTTFEQEILENFQMMEDYLSQIEDIRLNYHTSGRQPLYADFGECNMDKYLTEVMCKSKNLVQRDLSKLEGQMVGISNKLGKIKIDLVIHEELSNIGFGRELEKALFDYVRRHVSSNPDSVKLSLQIAETENEDLVYAVIRNVNWSKLNFEIQWSPHLDRMSSDVLEVKDLAKFLIKQSSDEL